MAEIRQLTFAGGEIAPALQARVDMTKYTTGLKTCRNFIVMRHGGVANRAGTEHIAEVGNSAFITRIFPFFVNETTTYLVEFGKKQTVNSGYVRFHLNGAQVRETAVNVASITQANPCVVNITPTAGTVWTAMESSRGWKAIAVSSTGVYMAACVALGQIYVSQAYGIGWSPKESNRDWNGIAVSSTGQYMAACVNSGYLYTSDNYGATWTQRDSSRVWTDISMSATGQYMMACVASGQIYKSSDYGVTWVAKDSARVWNGIAVSSTTGQYMIACVNSGQLYRSTDTGETWTAVESSRLWQKVAVSATGQYMLASVGNSYLFTSSDYGATWTARDSSRPWLGVSMGSTGQYMAACAQSSNYIYISLDYGVTWTAKESTRNWYDIACSGDNNYIAACVYDGQIYLSHDFAISVGDEIYLSGVGGMTILNEKHNFKVYGIVSGTSFQLGYMDGTAVDSTSFPAYTTGGTAARVYELQTPYYTTPHLNELKTAQFSKTMIVVQPDWKPKKLVYASNINWGFEDVVFSPQLAAPAQVSTSAPGAAYSYQVTAVALDTFEESLPSATVISSTQTSAIQWSVVPNAAYYNVYKSIGGTEFGWMAVSDSNALTDQSFAPDYTDNPPTDRQPFASVNNYPSAVGYYQQRLVLANTDNDVEKVWTSKTGLPYNFMTSFPSQDDDAVTFVMPGRGSNAAYHLLDLGRLIAFTAGNEWVVDGDASGALIPSAVNPRQRSSNGSNFYIMPVVINGSALYVQNRGTTVRDLAYNLNENGYIGNELSVYAAHMFTGKTIVSWAYQQIPHSIVWCVLDDGSVVALTYIREHQIWAWHRHDFASGFVEEVIALPEGTEDAVYFIIKRTINGVDKRFVERMASRVVTNMKDAIFTDATSSYDGRNLLTSHTMTLTGGTAWTSDENLTLTSSASFFASTDVGNAIFLYEASGAELRCVIAAYTSPTVVTVNAHKTVPVALRSVATASWSKAVDQLSGLWHLEGKSVSILADGYALANPNNSAYAVQTVAAGALTLDRPYAVIRVGLPITADLETLRVDKQDVSITTKYKNITGVSVMVESTRGLWAGNDATHLTEFKIPRYASVETPIPMFTGIERLNIPSSWSADGYVFLRQSDPLPATVLAITLSGYIPS